MGVSENSVSLNPMVLLIIIPIKWLFHWGYTLFSDKPTYPIDGELTNNPCGNPALAGMVNSPRELWEALNV